jgi:CRP/FNR family cyclic AMP-dependent transcriptional regulator
MSDLSRAEMLQVLRGVPLFSGLTKRQLSGLAKVVTHMTFEPGAVLLKELRQGQRLIIIRSGTAAVTRQGIVGREGTTGGIQQGQPQRIGTVGPGDIVGELSLIDGKPTTASVVAETPIDAVVLYRTDFDKLLASTPQLYPRLLIAMAERIRAMDQRMDIGA